MVKRARPDQRGFALVDAVVGGVLLSLVLMTFVSLTGRAVGEQRRGERLGDAARLADEQLELVSALGPEDYPGLIGTSGEFDEPFDAYRWETRFSTMRGQQDLYRVEMEVFWGDGDRERSILVETLVAVPRGERVEGERRPTSTVRRGEVEE